MAIRITQSLVQWEVVGSDTRVVTSNSICNKIKTQGMGRNRKVSPHTLGGKKQPTENVLKGDQIWDLIDNVFK